MKIEFSITHIELEDNHVARIVTEHQCGKTIPEIRKSINKLLSGAIGRDSNMSVATNDKEPELPFS